MPRTKYPILLNGKYLPYKESEEYRKQYPVKRILTPREIEDRKTKRCHVPDWRYR